MVRRHSREDILAGALDAVADDGLSQLTYGRLAKRLGISDRTVVYYFPTKDELLGAVLGAVGERLQATLATAFREPAADHLALARTAWPVLTEPSADASFALFFEATGLAAAGREPYRSLVEALVEAWIVWLSTFFDGTAAARRVEAESTIALVDGLLLLRQSAGAAAAQRAAIRLGVA